MINTNDKLYIAKKCLEKWSIEQDTTRAIYSIHAEDFFSRHLYDDLVDLQRYSAKELGEYVKVYMKYVNDELERIYEEEEQRALTRREQLNL